MIEQERLLSNPFPGLRPFETDENYLFFGRDGQSDQVLTKLRTSRFVAVVGTSGSGKSSLVRAGLLPALFSGHMTSAGSSWRIAVFRPGKSPISNLAQAFNDSGVFATRTKEDASVRLANIERTLRRSSLGLIEVVTQARMDPNDNLLILADQFEELFRFRKKSTDEHPEDEAAAFVKLLLETKQQDQPPEERLPIYVILTMRSDYLGDCAHFWGLPEAINEGQYLIPRMTDDDRREAITGPVIIGGGEITAPLVNRLLNDAGDDPAQLPILQHALMRTWNYWKTRGNTSRPIEISHYESIGGMLQALSNHADEAFWELPPESQRVAERLFKCITEKEADSREGRRPATVGEICAVTEADEDQVKAVIESFRSEGRSFLMPPPNVPLTTDTLIDISHESLIRGWQRLREWVDKEAQAARQYMRLADTASRFPEEEGFLRDPALHLGLKWLEDNRPTKAWAVRYHPGFDKTIEYLEASKANREAEIAEKERQQKEEVERELRHAEAMATEQKRRVKILRLGMLLLLILLLAMLGLTVFAFQQKREADTQRRVAERALTEVEVQRDNAGQAKDEAVRQRERAEEALSQAKHDREEADNQRDVAQKAEHKAVIQAQVAQHALAEAKRDRDRADEAQKSAVAAKKEAETERDNAKQALDAVDEIDRSADFFKAIMRGHTDEIYKAVFSPDGSMVISTSVDITTRAWDSQTGKPKPILPPSANSAVNTDHTAIANQVIASNTGNLVLMVNDYGGDRYGVIWDVRTNKELGRFKGSQGGASVIFSTNDKFIAINDRVGRTTTIYDTQTAKEIISFPGGANYNDMVFSPDGKRLVIASADASATVWDVATGKQVARLLGHLGEVSKAAFSPDGKFLVTASKDGTARVWDPNTASMVLTLSGHEGPVNSAVFDHDGKYIVTTSKNRAYLWEAKSPGTWSELSANSPTILAGHTGEVTNAVFSSDHKWIVTISQDRTAQLWPAKTAPGKSEGGVVQPALVASHAVFRGHIKPVTSVDITADSKYVVTGSADKTARVWNLAGIGGFSVTAAELKTEQSNYAGKCPVTVKFTGMIAVEGGRGTVKYRFIHSDGRPTSPQELTFDAPGSKEVSETSEVYGGVSRAGTPLPTSGWVQIEVLEPVEMKSNQAAFRVRCEEQGTQQGPGDLTDTQLKQIMPRLTDEQRARYLPYIRKAMDEFFIDTPLRQAAFLSEIAHNTGELRFLEEVGTDDALEKLYGQRKELGNYQPGDGARYKGRGAFMITGRSLYQSLSQRLGVDLVNRPELAATPDVAFRTAAFFWRSNGLNALADKSDLVSISRRINGGVNGIEMQRTYFEKAKIALGVAASVQ